MGTNKQENDTEMRLLRIRCRKLFSRLVTTMEGRLVLLALALLLGAWIIRGPWSPAGNDLRSAASEITVGGITFNAKSRAFLLKRQSTAILHGTWGKNFALNDDFTQSTCDIAGTQQPCLQWDRAKLFVGEEDNKLFPQMQCYSVYWEARFQESVPQDCFDIGDNHWYGGPELWTQKWPIERQEEGMQQYLSWDNGFNKNGYGSVMERYWLASNGVAIYVHDDCPLHYGIDSKQLCLKGDFGKSWFQNVHNRPPTLHYSICVSSDVKAVHTAMAQKFFSRPPKNNLPPQNMFRYPIWSTWARFKDSVTQEKTLNFAKEIKENNFSGYIIEIDDKYTETYGDHVYDPKKFPNPKQMIEELHELGFNVTSWVNPFVNTDAKAFADGVTRGYFVGNTSGTPALVKWWRGTEAGLLDVTNPEAVQWYFDRLSTLGMDAFKFDAGESNFLPPNYTTRHPLTNPNHYGRLYAEAAQRHCPTNNIEVRVGYKSQHLPVFVRMMDKESKWDYDRAFKTMIPNALQFGLEGYPFILPDMIGGNCHEGTTDLVEGDDLNKSAIDPNLPSKELYIRWLELNAFLPSMQYSIAPWQYDAETVTIARKWTKFHETIVTDVIWDLANKYAETGEPVIRPLRWIDPLDKTTFDIEDEFLVGDTFLVAPVLDKGVTARNIYLPKGKWKDGLREGIIEGPKWIRSYEIKLHEIAFFEQVL